MKSPQLSKINESLFKNDVGEQPVRLIKAAQVGKLLHGSGNGSAQHGSAEHQNKPQIRLIHSGADYCDIEIVCGCGESTQVRCWSSPAAEGKSAS